MGLGVPAAVRKQALSRWGALVDAPPRDATHLYVDVPAMLRKTVPQQPELPVTFGANKFATTYLSPASTLYVLFAFDTPAFHHSMRAAVGAKRSPLATAAQVAAYGRGEMPDHVLVNHRLFKRGTEPYPPGASDGWTVATPVCLARAMLTARDKARYYTLFAEALTERVCAFANAAGPLRVEIDGPGAEDEIITIDLAALGPDGRSSVARTRRPRAVTYGEADLKVQWGVTHCESGIPCSEAIVFTVDTDMVCQLLLSAPTLRALGIRATIVFPPQGKGADATREIVDCSRLPHGNTESIAFALLLFGCDYTSSCLGFGLNPEHVLLSASAAPAAFCVTPDRVVIRGPSLLGLLAQLKDEKKKPRKLYLCSAGRRHLSKQAATAASPLGFRAPPAVERNSRDLFQAVMSIVHVIWYWRFGGSSAAQAGPPPLTGTLGDVFGDGTLAEILAGSGPDDMAPEVTVGSSGDRDGTPSPSKRRRRSQSPSSSTD